MHEHGVKTYNEAAMADADRHSPIESALMELGDAQERAGKAAAVLSDRLLPVLQPEEPAAELASPGEKSDGFPQSATVRRISESAADLRRLANRLNRLMDRLDV